LLFYLFYQLCLLLVVAELAEAQAQGVFIDSPVEGVKYISGSQSGITDADGKFTYEAGKTFGVVVGWLNFDFLPHSKTSLPFPAL